jgi:acylphosphatase
MKLLDAMSDTRAMREPSPQTDDQRAVHLVVHGLVQGVGFRYYTRVSAQRAGVVGWVRNREDGTVEIRAEGSEERLKQFLQAVRRGPSHSRVTNVDVTWEPATTHTPFEARIRSFHIRD